MALELKDTKFQIHAPDGSELAVFELARQDQTSQATQYFLYIDLNGRYILMRKTYAAGVTTTEYAHGFAGYTLAWDNRAVLDYYDYDELRSNLA